MDRRGGYVVSASLEHASTARLYAFVPGGTPGGVPVVLVHGAASEARAQFHAFLPLASRQQVLLIVPEFRRPAFRGYQRLAGAAGPLAAAAALDAAVEEAARLTGVPIPRFDLAGYSGGAQFAHRYAMLFPGRVRRLAVGAAGWYTWLDSARAYPYGPRPSVASGHLAVNTAAFLSIPIRVLVGERDLARDRSLRAEPAIDAEQGAHRLERALRWAQHLQETAASAGLEADVTTELLPHTGHGFRRAMRKGGFGERVLDFFNSDRPRRASDATSPALTPGGTP
jgi:pimeloyl-ACP methyl ester carboxylesterase